MSLEERGKKERKKPFIVATYGSACSPWAVHALRSYQYWLTVYCYDMTGNNLMKRVRRMREAGILTRIFLSMAPATVISSSGTRSPNPIVE